MIKNMTNQQAIEVMRNYKIDFGQPGAFDMMTAIGMAEKALDKQIAKTPNYEGYRSAYGELVINMWICPGCGAHYEVVYEDYDFCPKCGQAIQLQDDQEEQT